MWEFISVDFILFYWFMCIFKPFTLVIVNEGMQKGFFFLILFLSVVHKDRNIFLTFIFKLPLYFTVSFSFETVVTNLI